VGVTLQLYDHGAALAKKGACCAGRDIHDARRVAEAMGFPHYVLDYENTFREAVIEEFADSLSRRRNAGALHPLQRTGEVQGPPRHREGPRCRLHGHGPLHPAQARPSGPNCTMAADAARDQSYFLFSTTPEQLDYLRFPLGHLASKAETRALAAKHGLPVADKPDSQDICFVPNGNYAAVIEKLRPGAAEPGEIVHADGRVLGVHPGVIHYTIGQRRGLGIGGLDEPLYVVRLDVDTRRVIVGPKELLSTRIVPLREVNWLGDAPLTRTNRMARSQSRSARPARRARRSCGRSRRPRPRSNCCHPRKA
jgi:tRNA-uridine 2-sulfurtransferase